MIEVEFRTNERRGSADREPCPKVSTLTSVKSIALLLLELHGQYVDYYNSDD